MGVLDRAILVEGLRRSPPTGPPLTCNTIRPLRIADACLLSGTHWPRRLGGPRAGSRRHGDWDPPDPPVAFPSSRKAEASKGPAPTSSPGRAVAATLCDCPQSGAPASVAPWQRRPEHLLQKWEAGSSLANSIETPPSLPPKTTDPGPAAGRADSVSDILRDLQTKIDESRPAALVPSPGAQECRLSWACPPVLSRCPVLGVDLLACQEMGKARLSKRGQLDPRGRCKRQDGKGRGRLLQSLLVQCSPLMQPQYVRSMSARRGSAVNLTMKSSTWASAKSRCREMCSLSSTEPCGTVEPPPTRKGRRPRRSEAPAPPHQVMDSNNSRVGDIAAERRADRGAKTQHGLDASPSGQHGRSTRGGRKCLRKRRPATRAWWPAGAAWTAPAVLGVRLPEIHIAEDAARHSRLLGSNPGFPMPEHLLL